MKDSLILNIEELIAYAKKRELFLNDGYVHKSLNLLISNIKYNQLLIGKITFKFKKRRVYKERHYSFDIIILLNNFISDLKSHLSYLNKEKHKINIEKEKFKPSRHPLEIFNTVDLDFTNKSIQIVEYFLKF
jgi:hypothetical protein